MDDVVEYIYDFLFDPDRDRWAESRVLYLLERAQEDIASKAKLYLQQRDVKRETTRLNSLATREETAQIPLVDGQDVYKLPDDFLRVVSVSYCGCFIRQVFNCDLDTESCNFDIRGYNVSAVARGNILVLPKPTSTKTISKDTTYKEVESTGGYASFGWGLIHGKTPQLFMEEEVMTLTETVQIDLSLDELDVVYEVRDIPEFEDNAAELLANITNDKQLLKYYTCGQLLRDDRDSNSRSLGNEELQLFNDRVAIILNSYDDIYVTDSVLQVKADAEGNIDTNMVQEVDVAEIKELDRGVAVDTLQEKQDVLDERKHKSRFGVIAPSGA